MGRPGITKYVRLNLHPALSIILFSSISGAGFGLGAIIGISGLPNGSSVFSSYPLLVPTFFAAAISSLGLLCSVLHLRRPDRAWRAFSQWRSSWLSREGVLAIITLVSLTGLAFTNPNDSIFANFVGIIASALCLLTVFATSMIYTQIKAVPAWNTSFTPVLYIVFAISGGLLSSIVLHAVFTGILPMKGSYFPAIYMSLFDSFAAASSVALFAAWTVQFLWWRRLDRIGDGESTAESATRIEGLGRVHLLESPHTGSNYLMDEMGFVIGRRHAKKLRNLSMLIGGLLPVFSLMLIQLIQLDIYLVFVLSFFALVTHIFGVILSRWLFFAEARHSVMLYYQTKTN